jgi:spermidine synthase
MSMVKKLASYIFPFSKKIFSEINGLLEVNWVNGKKVLDSPNANYSFGNLQKVLHFGLSKVFNKSIHNILVLGMGGGSVIHSLRNDFNYSSKITAVEIDPVVYQLAQTEFGIVASLDLILVLQDAKDYMQNNKEKFDLLMIDIFIDTEVPTPFMEKEFWTNIHKAMNPNAKVIFNYMDPAGSPSSFKTMLQYLDFDIQEYTYVLDTNSILILSC